jgi:phage virion morphogenesis protein
MSDIKIEVDLGSVKKLVDKLNRASFTPMLRDMGAYQKESVLLNFEYQGRPKKWPPLSEEYLAWKLREGYSSKMLILTGRLRNSINVEVTNTTAKVYSGVKYGVTHQLGLNGVPARPFLVVQNEDIQNLGKIASEFVDRLLRG